MQELIKVTTGAQGSQVVSARNLYEFLGYDKSQWKRWYEKNIINNPFAIEIQDWEGFDIVSNGNPTKDFALSLDFAKRLSQMAKTQKGEEVRNYFIECENRLRQNIQRPQTNEEILSSAVLLANRLLAEKDEQINKLAPKAEWTDKVLQSDANYTTTNIAKELGMGAKQLNTMLCKKKIQYWHDGRYVLYANYENEGYTATRTKPFIDSKGVQHTNMYMVWTERGRAFLHYLFNESLSYGKPAKAKKLTQSTVQSNLHIQA